MVLGNHRIPGDISSLTSWHKFSLSFLHAIDVLSLWQLFIIIIGKHSLISMATGNALTVQSRAVSASEALATCSTLSNQGVYGSNSFTGATTGPYPVFKDLNWHSVHIDCRNVFVRRANLITCSGYYPKEPGAQHLRVKEKMLNDDGFPLLLPASESPLHKWVRPGTVVVSTLPTASVSD